jgi:hypothetical protein
MSDENYRLDIRSRVVAFKIKEAMKNNYKRYVFKAAY